MQVFGDTFIPIEVGVSWFGSQPCPACDSQTLHPVANLAPARWVCSSCGRCWTPLHGYLDRVDPWTCAGCATRDRRECIARFQPDPARPESDEERDGPAAGPWELVARVAQAQSLICVQADCTADEALALMRESARATDRRVVEIARDVLAHRIWFD